MYLQGQKKSPISGKSLGLGFFSLRESFHFLVWLCSLGLRPRLHNCQTAKFIPWSDCVASASGLGYTTVRPRNENFLSRKRNPGRELFHLWSTCFRPYRTFIPYSLSRRWFSVKNELSPPRTAGMPKAYPLLLICLEKNGKNPTF